MSQAENRKTRLLSQARKGNPPPRLDWLLYFSPSREHSKPLGNALSRLILYVDGFWNEERFNGKPGSIALSYHEPATPDPALQLPLTPTTALNSKLAQTKAALFAASTNAGEISFHNSE